MAFITNKIVEEIYDRCDGNVKCLHQTLCKFAGKDPNTVNLCSLQIKAKRTIHFQKKLKQSQNKERYNEYCNEEFIFPRLSMKRKLQPVADNTCTLHEKTIKNLQNSLQILRIKYRNINLSRLNQKLKRQQSTINRLQNEIQSLKKKQHLKNLVCTKEVAEKSVQCNTVKRVIDDLNSQIEGLHLELDFNNSNDKDTCTENDNILNFRLNEKGKPYNEKLRKLYYLFLSRRIGLQHIQPIIKGVLSLVDFEIEQLPSISTASKMFHELGTISRKQINDELSNEKNITMHRDATTKKGRHFYGIEYATENGKTLTTGLREVSDGKSETYVSCVHEILKDVSGDSAPILKNTINFMTDRSITEVKTNRILTSEKLNLLQEPSTINEFKCSVHPLLQFSEVCQKEIIKFESETDLEKSDQNTATLLRFVSKLFFKDGSGDPLFAATYLKEKGISTIPIMNFRGNRFNVLFYNAAGTFYLAPYLVQYFENSKSTLNFTQNYILKALKNDKILVILRALGILYKIITQPYMNKASDEKCNALSMGSTYNRLIYILKDCTDNPSLLLKNNISVFYGPFEPPDFISQSLFMSSHLDIQTEQILARLARVLKIKCESLFKDFIEGGKYYKPSEFLIKEATSCPSNNITVERLMAKLDSQLRTAPTANISSIENSILYKNNDTETWLENKSENEQGNIISSARKEVKQNISVIKNRKKQLFNNHVLIIKEREKAQRKKLEKRNKEIQERLEHMRNVGIWQNKDIINKELNKLRTKTDKIKSLKKQINMMKDLVCLDHQDKPLVLFSSNGKQHSEEKLVDNLLKLLEIKNKKEQKDSDSISIENTILDQLQNKPLSLIGKSVQHTWYDEDKHQDETWEGRIISYTDGIFQVNISLTVHNLKPTSVLIQPNTSPFDNPPPAHI